MTKTCGTCGHAALDDQAQFCNRCGAAVPEKKKPAFPVCSRCGTVIADELAQYCNRCGAGIPMVPAVCSSCGSPALDDHSRFCTRCGTTFEHTPVQRSTICPSCGAPDPQGLSVFCNRCGVPFNRPGMPAAHLPVKAPVLITQKKPAGPLPVVTVPDSDWEPWSDVPAAFGVSKTAGPGESEQSASPEEQIAIPQKRYAHLPLVADEMKKKGEPNIRHAPDIPGVSQKKKAVSQKKGVLGFLKKE